MKKVNIFWAMFWFVFGFIVVSLIMAVSGCTESIEQPSVDQQEQVEPQKEIEPDQPDISVDIGQGSIDIRYPGGGVDIKRRFRLEQ